jgi:hypothetical protein
MTSYSVIDTLSGLTVARFPSLLSAIAFLANSDYPLNWQVTETLS